MVSTESHKDIILFKQAIEKAHTPENGWEVIYDGPISKKYSSIVVTAIFCNMF